MSGIFDPHHTLRRAFYRVQEWRCATFGHDPYWETRTFRAHWACKRGCGPVDSKERYDDMQV